MKCTFFERGLNGAKVIKKHEYAVCVSVFFVYTII